MKRYPPVGTSADGGRFMKELIPGLRELLYAELGVMLPGVRVRGETRAIPPYDYRILLSEIPLSAGVIPQGKVLVLASREHLQAAGLSQAREVEIPGVGAPVCQLPSETEPELHRLKLQTIDPPTQMVHAQKKHTRIAIPGRKNTNDVCYLASQHKRNI